MVITTLLVAALLVLIIWTQLVFVQGHPQEVVAEIAANKIRDAYRDYEFVGSMLHMWCEETRRRSTATTTTGHGQHAQIRDFYENLMAHELQEGLQYIGCALNITHEERLAREAISRQYLEEFYPNINYFGFTGLEVDEETGTTSVQTRSEQPFYYPLTFLEPLIGNEFSIDFDLFSSPPSRDNIQQALSDQAPTIYTLQIPGQDQRVMQGIQIFHPGIVLSNPESNTGSDVAVVELTVHGLLLWAFANESKEGTTVYLYEGSSTEANDEKDQLVFLGGLYIGSSGERSFVSEEDDSIGVVSELMDNGHSFQIASNTTWTVFVVQEASEQTTQQPTTSAPSSMPEANEQTTQEPTTPAPSRMKSEQTQEPTSAPSTSGASSIMAQPSCLLMLLLMIGGSILAC